MKHLCSLFMCYLLVTFHTTTQAQNKSWNLLLEKKVARFIGSQVYETDSFYIVVGTSVDSFGFVEQGFSISKVDKKNGSLVHTSHYEEQGVQFDFNRSNNGFIIDNAIYFPQKTQTRPYSVRLFKTNINTLQTESLMTVYPPDTTSIYNMFLYDFIIIDKASFILTDYYIGEFNTPTFKAIPIMIKHDLRSNETDIIRFFNFEGKHGMNRLANLDENILIFGSIMGEKIGTGNMTIFNLDLNGQKNWEYQTPNLSPIYDVKDIHSINDKEVLLASYDSFFDYSDFQLYSRWTVTRYDVANNKIVWSNFWDELRKPYIWSAAKFVKTKNEGEYFLMANDYVGNDTSNYTTGKIVKFNENGQRMWQKTYYYRTNWALSNDFNNIISTSDGNFLIVGYESKGRAPWLVKIDEDGNILPIDTTSTTTEHDIANSIPEIKVYPNPASHAIIINQGEITDMNYQLIDMAGQVVKTIPLPQAHHHVIWDISDVASGTYILTMLQGGKVIGTRQQVVLK